MASAGNRDRFTRICLHRAGAGSIGKLDRRSTAISAGDLAPGVFAAGDVRSGSVKRVASAVGEGSMVIQFVHAYLKELQGESTRRLPAGSRQPNIS